MLANTATTYRALVVNNQDPEGRGRVQLQIPQLMGGARSGWAMPVPAEGTEPPEVGHQVLAAFEGADLTRPVYFAPADTALAREALADAATAEADAQAGITKAAAAQSAADHAQASADGAQTTANNALGVGQGAQNTASGKSTLFWSTAVPTNGVGVTGDLHLRTSGTSIISAWKRNSDGTWTQHTWSGATLLANSVPGSALTDASVTGGKLAPATVTGDKLQVGNLVNLLPNGAFEWGSAANWHPTLQPYYQTTDVPTGLTGAITTAAGQGTLNPGISGEIVVTPGAEVRFDVWLKADVTGSNIYWEFRDQANNLIPGWSDATTGTGSANYPLGPTAVPTTWTKFQRRTIVPNGVSRIRVAGVYFNHPSGSVTTAKVSVAGATVRVSAPGGAGPSLPFAMAVGQATVPAAAGTGIFGALTVSLPAGRFTQPPRIVVSGAGVASATSYVRAIPRVDSVSTSSFRITTWAGDGSTVTNPNYVMWIAVQGTMAGADF